MAEEKETLTEEELVQEQAVEIEEESDVSGNDDTEQVEVLKKQIDSLTSSLQQERAEFMNFKKRSLQEKADLEGYVAGKILKDLLPTFDAFDMFFTSTNKQLENTTMADEVKKILEGVGLIQKQLFAIFGDLGIEEFDPLHNEFDPNSMEALSLQESDEAEFEKVVAVFQKGYLLKGKVLRPARVVVAKPAQKEKREEENKE